jgi:hypothetical protein
MAPFAASPASPSGQGRFGIGLEFAAICGNATATGALTLTGAGLAGKICGVGPKAGKPAPALAGEAPRPLALPFSASTLAAALASPLNTPASALDWTGTDKPGMYCDEPGMEGDEPGIEGDDPPGKETRSADTGLTIQLPLLVLATA